MSCILEKTEVIPRSFLFFPIAGQIYSLVKFCNYPSSLLLALAVCYWLLIGHNLHRGFTVIRQGYFDSMYIMGRGGGRNERGEGWIEWDGYTSPHSRVLPYPHLFANRALQTIFHLCIPKKISQASLLISSKYFHQSGIIIFSREVQYWMQPFSCQQREQHIPKRNYEITVQCMRFIFPNQSDNDGHLNLFITFSNVYIWGLGWRFWDHSFWDHGIQMNFQYIFSQL